MSGLAPRSELCTKSCTTAHARRWCNAAVCSVCCCLSVVARPSAWARSRGSGSRQPSAGCQRDVVCPDCSCSGASDLEPDESGVGWWCGDVEADGSPAGRARELDGGVEGGGCRCLRSSRRWHLPLSERRRGLEAPVGRQAPGTRMVARPAALADCVSTARGSGTQEWGGARSRSALRRSGRA